MTGQAPITKTAVKNGTVSLPNNPTKSGFVFNGWNTKENGSGSAFTASTKVTDSITVYAQWKNAPKSEPAPAPAPAQPKTITITFDSNGGSKPNPSTRQVTIGAPIGPLPVVTRDGYNFAGWFNAREGGGQLAADGSGAISGNYTMFYAHWTKINPSPSSPAPTHSPPPPAPTPSPPKPNYSAYQSQIQGKCSFNDPNGVWAVIEQHSDPAALYKKLADTLTRNKSNDDYKNVILVFCKFSNSSDVWTAINKHSSPDSVYRVLAQGLVGNRTKASSVSSSFTEQLRQIQTVCNFGKPEDVWKAFDTHPYKNALYKTFAEGLSRSKTRNEYKEVIKALCNFSNADNVWAVLDRHSGADAVYRSLAQNMVGK